jgi:hypothetical protein
MEMRKRIHEARVAAMAAVIALGTLGAASVVGPVQSSTDCTVTVAEPIPIQADPVVVSARYSATLTGPLSATVSAESKVTVAAVSRVENEPMTARLTLGTAEAVAGEYDLTVKGDSAAVCSGRVKVGM